MEGRIFSLNKNICGKGPVIYWMSRDQRVMDNWALLYALEKAEEQGVPAVVVFNLCPSFAGASERHFSFMLEGLKEVEKTLTGLRIPFVLLKGNPEEEIPAFAEAVGAGLVVADFSPLKISLSWKTAVSERLKCAFTEVDAHNIVPCRRVSPKKEYAARTIRPKINSVLTDWLADIPKPQKPVISFECVQGEKTELLTLKDHGYGIKPGEKAASEALDIFINQRLSGYDILRNNPCADAQSGLSPYLHFGQISAQRVALKVKNSGAPENDINAFLEELIIRRELAENFCFYEENYDNLSCADGWAAESLEKHRMDTRDYVYDYEAFALAKTHDRLWNAAQNELINTGKIHGYMRMYWAKKILEWTENAEEAFGFALRLNDSLALDGRDPNGYTGVAWSIAGVHDRAWPERKVFGKIRFMNYNGCRSKFDTEAYIRKHSFY